MQLREAFPQDFFHLLVEAKVERGLQLCPRAFLRLLQNQFHKMRRAKTTGRRAQRERLRLRPVEPRRVK